MLVLRENFLVTESSGPTGAQGKILLANSHQPTLEALKSLLEEHHYCVQATGDGTSAIKAAKESLPDIILLGTQFQDMTGFDVSQQLQEEETTRCIPTLFIVTAEQPEAKESIFKAGGADFISNPFCKEEILRRVEIHLQMLRLRAELEKETKEKERLSQENKHWERSFFKKVKQSTVEMEEAFILERAAREQMINTATLAMMNKMAALVVHELSSPLRALQENLIQIKSMAQENPTLVETLEYSLVEVERLLKTITEMNQISEL